jgi:hypothetical protein
MAVGRVITGAYLHPGDVMHPRNPSVVPSLEHDIAELSDIGEATQGVHRSLISIGFWHGWLADHPRCHLHILLAQRLHDVTGGQVARRDLVGIQPDAHAVFARAEDGHIRHTRFNKILLSKVPST